MAKIPELWDYIRAEIDDTGGKGLFILTGSAKPIDDKNRHSGIGRFKNYYENNEFMGKQ